MSPEENRKIGVKLLGKLKGVSKKVESFVNVRRPHILIKNERKKRYIRTILQHILKSINNSPNLKFT